MRDAKISETLAVLLGVCLAVIGFCVGAMYGESRHTLADCCKVAGVEYRIERR